MSKGLGSAGVTLLVNNNSTDKQDEAFAEYKASGFNAHGYIFHITDEKADKEAV